MTLLKLEFYKCRRRKIVLILSLIHISEPTRL